MAIVPRLLWQNFLNLSNTVVAASSQDSALVSEYLRDPLRSKVWRSATGWTIVAGFNDKLDFNLSGAKVATIAPGTYATGALLATAVYTALTAAYATGVWTVTYSTSTFKFTIVHSITAHTLLPVTGTNAATTILKDLGWNADAGSATTHTSDIAVYQSQHYITADLGSALQVKSAVVMQTMNISTSATVKVKYSATSLALSLSAPDGTQTLTGDADVRLVAFDVTKRYWSLVIDDRTNTAGYCELGLLYIGSYFQPALGMSNAISFSRQELTSIGQADQGASWVDIKQSRRVIPHKYLGVTEAQKDIWETMATYVKAGRQFIYVIDSGSATPYKKTFYGFIGSGVQIEHQPPAYYIVTLDFVEALG